MKFKWKLSNLTRAVCFPAKSLPSILVLYDMESSNVSSEWYCPIATHYTNSIDLLLWSYFSFLKMIHVGCICSILWTVTLCTLFHWRYVLADYLLEEIYSLIFNVMYTDVIWNSICITDIFIVLLLLQVIGLSYSFLSFVVYGNIFWSFGKNKSKISCHMHMSF